MTRSDVGKGHPEYYQDMARAHRRARRRAPSTSTSSATRPTRWRTRRRPARRSGEQMDGDVDAVVVGVGSGGTITGLARYFAQGLAEDARWCSPIRSARSWRRYVKTGKHGRGRLLDGRGHRRGFRAADLPISRGSRRPTRSPTRRASAPRASCCARKASSAARRPARCSPRRCATAASRQTPKRVVTFVCDSGNKYLSKMFNDFWMVDQGLLEREQHGDLRDLIVAPHRRGRTRHRRPGRHAAHRLSAACGSPTSRSCRCWTTASSSASSTSATSCARRRPL